MKIPIQRLHPDAILPGYAHGPDEDAAMDLCALERVVLTPGVAQPSLRESLSSCRAATKRRCAPAAAWR
jgi:hypothetical protein